MKVVQVITRGDDIGGAQLHVLSLAKGLLAEAHEVTVLAGGEGSFTEELRARGVPYRPLNHLGRPIHLVKDARAFAEIRSVLKELSPELVATHSSKAGLLGRLAARSLGIPVLFTVHGWAFSEGVPALARLEYTLLERAASPLASRIITVSDYDRALAISLRVAPPDKMVTVHNGVEDVPATQRANPELQPPRMIMVARFAAPKDHYNLIKALAGLTDLPWEIDLVGDGPLLRETAEAVSRWQLSDRVHFCGARKDVPELLAQAQIFVLTSRWEGLPLTVLEAMRAGLPVVASDVGGVSEAVADGENGCLVPRGDVQALSTTLRRLLTDPKLRAVMGSESRKRYEAHFTVKRMLEKTFTCYQDVLQEAHIRSMA